jgi:hypothetical protein
MEDCWPSSVALRGETLNHPMLRRLKTVVVSDGEKAHEMCQVGTRKTCQSVLLGLCAWRGVVVEASKIVRRHRNWGYRLALGTEPGGCPCIGQAVPGVEAA